MFGLSLFLVGIGLGFLPLFIDPGFALLNLFGRRLFSLSDLFLAGFKALRGLLLGLADRFGGPVS